MTVLVDLPPHLAGRVEAEADAQGRLAADIVRAAVARWYDEADASENAADDAGDTESNLSDAIYQTYPLPLSLTLPVREMMQNARADVDAGRIIDGETFLAKLHRRTQEYRAEANAASARK